MIFYPTICCLDVHQCNRVRLSCLLNFLFLGGGLGRSHAHCKVDRRGTW